MDTILERARAVYRAFDTDDVPATGPREPDKGEIRGLFALVQSRIDELIGAVAGGGLTPRATRAAAYASNPDVGALAYVYADDVDPTRNGVYVHISAGTGAVNWLKTDFLMGSAALASIAAVEDAVETLQASATVPLTNIAGSVNAVTADAAGVTVSNGMNQVLRLYVAGGSANTTASPTLNVNGAGAVEIKAYDGSTVAIGQLVGDLLIGRRGANWRVLTKLS